jgi:type II pantothenate kinase
LSLHAGVDVGATLAKIVTLAEGAPLEKAERAFLPASDREAVVRSLESAAPVAIGVTGAGARAVVSLLGRGVLVDEFVAWGRGERALAAGADFVPTSPHLLVSLGTGTSILRVDADGSVKRVGGTALGGGTLRGLSTLLLGDADHARLAALALEGDRRRVDLLVSDLYGVDEIALADDLTAASFGKVDSPRPADLAGAIARLVAENVGLIAGALAASIAHGTDVVYAGSTLAGHETLREILAFATKLAGGTPRFLPHGEFAGATGALLTAAGSG